MRLSFGSLLLAAFTAAGITWIVMMLGATASVAIESGPDNGLGLAFIALVLTLFGLMVALTLGTVYAAVALAAAFLIADRGPDRRRALLIAGAACGAAYPALGLLTLALGEGSALQLPSYVLGFWLWAEVYEGNANTAIGMAVITLAPVIGGLAAGHVYEWLTRPEPKGLTTPDASAI